MKKKSKMKKPSNFLKFMNAINESNLIKAKKYYSDYSRYYLDSSKRENYIYNIKELPHNKNAIKLALKRLILLSYVGQNNDWYYLHSPTMEDLFVSLAQFQKIKTQPIKNIKNKKILQLYKKENFVFKDFIKVFREGLFQERTK